MESSRGGAGPGSHIHGGATDRIGGGGAGGIGGGRRGYGGRGFGSSGNNRYRGDFDSDGADENYSDDEDTGYMLLGNAEQIQALNAEGGEVDEDLSHN